MGGERERSRPGSWAPASIDELVATLPDHLPELIVLLDEDGGILWCNLTGEAVLGWRFDDWAGRNIAAILHPDDALLAHELLVSARATGPGVKEPVTYRIASVHDGWIELEVVASTVHLATGRTVLVVSGRVRGRNRHGELIAGEVGERMSFVFEAAVVPMVKVGLDGRILRANPAFARRAGTPAVDLHGVSLLGLVDPADRPAVAAASARIAAAPVDSDPIEVDARLAGPHPACLHLSLVPDWLGEPMYLFVQAVDRATPGPDGAPA